MERFGVAVDVGCLLVRNGERCCHRDPAGSGGPAEERCCGLMDGYVWGACVVAVIAWIMPAQSDLRLGDEELLGANQIGYLCGFAFFFAQYLMREQKRRLVAPATLLVVTMLRCLSKTTLIAFLISEGFLLVMDKSMRRRTKVCCAGLGICADFRVLGAL